MNQPQDGRREPAAAGGGISVYSVVFTTEEGRTEFEVFQLRGAPKTSAERADDMLRALSEMRAALDRG